MYAATASSLGGLSGEARALLIRSAEAEEIAAEIMHRKRVLVDLDRQRQECMQALATFRNKKDNPSKNAPISLATPPSSSSLSNPSVPSSLRAPPAAKLWVSFGSGFVKLPRDHVATLLATDRTKLDQEIETIREEMKALMAQLQAVQQSLGIPKGLLDFALKP